jgi:DNA-binding beta-propeller fold protein YncE
MPLAVAAPPQQVQSFGGFDYVTIDEARHRAYAAHTSSERLLIVDTQTGNVTGQVRVGPMHGVQVDPATGDVFTGNGSDQSVSKVDPVAMKVLASVDLPGNIDGITYDAQRKRIYADEDGGTHVYVIDANTMKQIGTIVLPIEDLEGLTVDPKTGTLYQNANHGGGFAVVDPTTLKVRKVVKTPQLVRPHPMVYARAANQLVVGGKNGILSAYTLDGKHLGDTKVQTGIDQCNTGSKGALVVCAGDGVVTVLAVKSGAAPELVATLDTGHSDISTVGIDESTNEVWVVWADDKGDWVQNLKWTP